MQSRKLFLLPVCFVTFSFVSYAQDSAVDATALNGNWHLSSGDDSKSGVTLNLNLGVDGNKIFGEGHFYLPCKEHGQTNISKFPVFLRGNVASDGSFVLANPLVLVGPLVSVGIQGRIPPDGAHNWSGSLATSFFTQSGSHDDDYLECPAVSNDFVATQFPPLNGVYTGTVRILYMNDVSESTVSLEIAQGRLVLADSPGGFSHVIPLGAKITVTGSPYFPAKTFDNCTQPQANNRISGSGYVLQFLDNRDLAADGDFDPSDESRIRVNLYYSSKDNEGKLHLAKAEGWLKRAEVAGSPDHLSPCHLR